jgi:DNA-binding Xre family transcriptional regulator
MVELRVRELAEERGITNPFSLSKESGVAYSNCYKLWNGQHKMISLDTLDRLCEALGCEPGDILVKVPATGRKAGARKSRR